MIRLSLIIATYNRAVPLLTALDSVAQQSAPAAEWECVVVNNNSQDDTVARFEVFAARYPSLNLRLVTERQQGLSHARNRGIAETTGQYIAIIDDDERINPGFIAAYTDFFDAHPEVASAGGQIIPEYPEGRPAWMSKYTEIPLANPIDLGDRSRPFPEGRIPGGGNMALRRTAIEKYGAFDPTLGRSGTNLIGGEESDLFERLSRAGEQCWYVPGAVMWHIIPPQKLTEAYFWRLCFHIGLSQQVRSRMNGRYWVALFREGLKWIATLLLTLTLRSGKSRWLLHMRYEISRGLVCKVKSER